MSETRTMTAEAFEAALAELGWKGAEFCRRTGLVANTVWRWRKGIGTVPPWAGEYLRAMLALQRLHAEFVAVGRQTGRELADDDGASGPAEGAAEGGSGAAIQ
jgi:transcriptional regulator with XRE-family HTH domain